MIIGIDCRLWNESGVGRYTRNLVKNLQHVGKKNEYVLFALTKDISQIKFQIANCKLQIVPADIRWHTIKEQLEFPKIINREKLDLMHFPYFSVPIFYNKPFVVTIHDLILHHFPTGQASTLSPLAYRAKLLGYKYIIQQAAKKAKKIITVSNATKQEIIDHLKIDPKKIAVTYEGADEKVSSIKYQVSSIKTPYFLYVGNAYPHKNLERLIEAFSFFCHPELVSGSRLSRDSDLRQNDTKLVLVGREDFFYKRLKQQVKKMGLENSVKFFGEATDKDLRFLYDNAVALVIPSLMEGFGLPALEAMVNKCLVLASDIPSLREVCSNTAIYFNPYDINEMVQKMKEVYQKDKSNYSDLIQKGYERTKLFSWEKMARETLRIYESCVGL